jgi:hypothetical protein
MHREVAEGIQAAFPDFACITAKQRLRARGGAAARDARERIATLREEEERAHRRLEVLEEERRCKEDVCRVRAEAADGRLKVRFKIYSLRFGVWGLGFGVWGLMVRLRTVG